MGTARSDEDAIKTPEGRSLNLSHGDKISTSRIGIQQTYPHISTEFLLLFCMTPRKHNL